MITIREDYSFIWNFWNKVRLRAHRGKRRRRWARLFWKSRGKSTRGPRPSGLPGPIGRKRHDSSAQLPGSKPHNYHIFDWVALPRCRAARFYPPKARLRRTTTKHNQKVTAVTAVVETANSAERAPPRLYSPGRRALSLFLWSPEAFLFPRKKKSLWDPPGGAYSVRPQAHLSI